MNEDTMNDDGRGVPGDAADRALRAELRAASPAPPVDGVDWAALHGRIMARSAGGLAAARRSGFGGVGAQHGVASKVAGTAPHGATPAAAGGTLPTWWQLMAEQAFRGVPLTASVTALAALLLVVVTGARAVPPGEFGSAGFVTVEEELYDGLPDAARPLLLAGIEEGALLDAALFQAGEEW